MPLEPNLRIHRISTVIMERDHRPYASDKELNQVIYPDPQRTDTSKHWTDEDK